MQDVSFPITDPSASSRTERRLPRLNLPYRFSFGSNSWKSLLTEENLRELPAEVLSNIDIPAETSIVASTSTENILAQMVKNEKITPVVPASSSASFSIDTILSHVKNERLAPISQTPLQRISSDLESPAPSSPLPSLFSSSESDVTEQKVIKGETVFNKMEKFPEDKVSDFKHVIYNLLVDGHNAGNPLNSVIFPCKLEIGEQMRDGFEFNETMDPDKTIPELYGYHIHQSKLENENQHSPFIQDLYKFYLRAGVELLGKYFEKVGKHTFLYDPELPLFVAGGSLRDAENRIKKMRTRARKKEREITTNESQGYAPFKKKKGGSRKIPYYIKCGLKL